MKRPGGIFVRTPAGLEVPALPGKAAPFCLRCLRPAAIRSVRQEGQTLFIASCHGQTEHASLLNAVLDEARRRRLRLTLTPVFPRGGRTA